MIWELSGLAALLLAVYKYTQYRQCDIPGPVGLPIIGNIFQVKKGFHQVMSKWAKQHGDIFQFSILKWRIIVVNSRELIREVLLTRSDEFAGRPALFRLRVLSNNGKGILFQDLSNEFKMHKKYAITSLRLYGDGLQKLEDISRDCISDFMQYIDTQSGVQQDYCKIVTTTVVNVITSMVLGKKFPLDNPEVYQFIVNREVRTKTLANSTTFIYDLFPFLVKFSGGMQKFLSGHEENMLFLRKHLDELEKNFDRDNITCFAESIYKHHLETKSKNGEPMIDYEHYECIVRTILQAGFETTSSSMALMLTVLSQNPQIQKRISEEVVDCCGPEEFPQLADRDKMPYTDACVYEILRYASHLPMGGPHRVTKNLKLGGYKVPKDTIIFANLWNMHHDERYWEEPWTFNPERWLNEQGTLVDVDHPNRKTFAPFSLGRRFCLGETLAKNRLFLFTAAILQKFDIIAPTNPPPTPFDIRDEPFGFIIKKTTLPLAFKKREIVEK